MSADPDPERPWAAGRMDPRLDIAAETAIGRLDGVAAATFSPGDEQAAGLLRLDLAPGADEVEVATSVGRLLRERFDLLVDPSAVRVVEEAFAVATGDADVAVTRLCVVNAGRSADVSVDAEVDGRPATGRATGDGTRAAVARAVADATLAALAEVRPALAGARAEVVRYGETPGAPVEVSVTRAAGAGVVSGASVVRQDPRQAVLRAVVAGATEVAAARG